MCSIIHGQNGEGGGGGGGGSIRPGALQFPCADWSQPGVSSAAPSLILPRTLGLSARVFGPHAPQSVCRMCLRWWRELTSGAHLRSSPQRAHLRSSPQELTSGAHLRSSPQELTSGAHLRSSPQELTSESSPQELTSESSPQELTSGAHLRSSPQRAHLRELTSGAHLRSSPQELTSGAIHIFGEAGLITIDVSVNTAVILMSPLCTCLRHSAPVCATLHLSAPLCTCLRHALSSWSKK
uniref:Uncharacterized protein n=1 Tax=Knipowitschia caucasica TaxID=637954 RepID=A0AAV2LSZ1_KNICA